MSIKQVKLGEKAAPSGIPKYKGSVKAKSIACIPSSKRVLCVETYYHSKIGFWYANNMTDREVLGKPKQRYVMPLIVYDVKSFPKDYGEPMLINFLMLSQKKYSALCEKMEMYGDLSQYDLVISCDDDQYQDLQVDVLVLDGNPVKAKLRRSKEMFNKAKELLGNYNNLIEDSVASKISDQNFRKLYFGEGESGASGQELNNLPQGSEKGQSSGGDDQKKIQQDDSVIDVDSSDDLDDLENL